MTSYQKKTEKQKEGAEILFKEYPDIHMAYWAVGNEKSRLKTESASFTENFRSHS